MTNEELDLIDPINIDSIDSYLTKDKSLAKKRRFDITKALRKRSIAHSYALFVYTGWYDNLHQYSKNKIHCSNKICRTTPISVFNSINFTLKSRKTF